MKHTLLILMLCMALPLSAEAVNITIQQPSALNQAAGGTLPVQWPSNSISWSQLMNVFSSNPGFSAYNIQFPNGSNWNLSSNTIQSLTQEARSLGYSAQNMPNLSFSSTGVSNMAMVPISAVANGMDQTLDPVLRELRYKEMDLSDSIPDWLKSSILWTWDMLQEGYAYLHDQYIQHFG